MNILKTAIPTMTAALMLVTPAIAAHHRHINKHFNLLSVISSEMFIPKIRHIYHVYHSSYHRVNHNKPIVIKPNKVYNIGSQCGIASWYSLPRQRTANGESMNPNAMTAAHKSLPFGTMVRVTSRNTGHSIIVRINDRGPYVRGRIIDLSKAAANRLGLGGIGSVCLSKI